MPAAKKFIAATAKANGVDNPAKTFAVEPQKSRVMRAAMRKSSAFLSLVNIVTKQNNAGEIIGITTGLTASRKGKSATGYTDADGRRQPKTQGTADKREYRLRKVNFDTAFTYEQLDEWAAEPNYLQLVQQGIVKSKAESLISIGFNGKEWAVTSNPESNPLLQDCGKGWLQQMRETNQARTMGWQSGQIGTTKQAVKYGPGAETYKNLDAVVMDAVSNLLAEEFNSRQDLVVICNRSMLDDKYFAVVNGAEDKATELNAADVLASKRRIGGIDAIAVPYFPANTLFITPLANLSIYFHATGHRRSVKDEPEFDRVANYESENIDFVIEELGAAALIENIEYTPA
ncbi:phage major capsid protein, P2 family [Neisseria sp. S1]|uniref:phage major capsid protein, P2 family n=1 Tax=Neisseria sp. S1 TaxID=3318354 RepID=UPI003A8B7E21